MHKFTQVLFYVLILSALTVAGAHAEAWTYDQGFNVGCGIGQDEEAYGQFFWLMTNTETMATQAGEFQYAAGVLEGYQSCRYIGEVIEDPRDGMVFCNIFGCSEDQP